MASSGSNAPVLTLPACAQMMVGPAEAGPPCVSSAASSASGRMRPCPSAATRISCFDPTPSMRSAPITDTCTSSPTMTRSRGASCKPSASTSQFRRRNNSCRAAAKRRKVRHVTAADESDTRVGRQTKQIEQPSGGNFFDDRRRRGHHVQRRRLIPRPSSTSRPRPTRAAIRR